MYLILRSLIEKLNATNHRDLFYLPLQLVKYKYLMLLRKEDV